MIGIREKKSADEIYETFRYRRKYSFHLGKLDNISLFVYQLPDNYIGITSMDYNRELTMDELEIINYENYKFITSKTSINSFIHASQNVIDFLGSIGNVPR